MTHERWSSSLAPSGPCVRLTPHLSQRRHDVVQHRSRILAARDKRTGQFQPLSRLQQQENALGARKLGGFVEQEFMQLRGAAQLVQAQPGVDQPLERFAQIRFTCQMRHAPLR